jgi:hypothetical protein
MIMLKYVEGAETVKIACKKKRNSGNIYYLGDRVLLSPRLLSWDLSKHTKPSYYHMFCMGAKPGLPLKFKFTDGVNFRTGCLRKYLDPRGTK